MSILRLTMGTFLVLAAGNAEASLFVVTNTNASGPGSLSKAIADANSFTNADTINFDIPGPGVHTIGGTLPPITQPVTIDGYTQPGSIEGTSTDGAIDAVILIELDASGVSAGGAMLRIDSGTTLIRGLAINGIKANGAGIEVSEGAAGTQSIKGCFIGTDAAGTVDSSSGNGIVVRDSAVIGGKPAAERNLISGNSGAGIELRGPLSTVVNNLIGTGADGTTLIGNGTGVLISSAAATGNVVGGNTAGSGNVIAGSTGDGIRASASATGNNRFEGNDIHDNGGLGIDLAGDGVTANDEADPDIGPNGLQNFPVLTFARLNGTSLSIEGHLESSPGSYRVEFFRNAEPDPSGFGEGEGFLQALSLTVPVGKTIAFFRASVTLPEVPAAPFLVTATAGRSDTSATSEFSRPIEFVAGGTVLTVTNANAAGAGSLAAVISAANQNADINTVVFAIPVPVQSIQPLDGYVLTNPVIIDGYTQKGTTISAPNRLATGSDAIIGVVLDGSDAPDDTPAFEVASPGCLIRGLAIHSFDGEAILAGDADGLRVEGNFIGTDVTGMTDLGNGRSGISTANPVNVSIGGPIPAQRNIISANQGSGVEDLGVGTTIVNNIIGGNATGGGNLGNQLDGILASGDDSTIGGDDERSGNVLRANGRAGISVAVGTGNRILGNSILANAGLGIDLEPVTSPGVTPNDLHDNDGGANSRQNFPEITDASVLPGSLLVAGSLDVPQAAEGDTYTIRLFENATCDASGHGEGAVFLGAADVVLSGDDEQFMIDLPVNVDEGAILAATVTDAALGNTSEFSNCFVVSAGEVICGDPSGEGDITASDALATLRAAVGSFECELCRCDANDTGGITATDALLVLKAAVGQAVSLECPACT